MVLPITRAGQTTPYGVLIAGISPRREFDEDYRGFYDLLADGVTTAIANARAYEEERARVEALAAFMCVISRVIKNCSASLVPASVVKLIRRS